LSDIDPDEASACGVEHLADALRISLYDDGGPRVPMGADFTPPLQSTRTYYYVRSMFKDHKTGSGHKCHACKRKFHPSTGKQSMLTLCQTLIHDHRDDIDGSAEMLTIMAEMRAQETSVLLAKKESADRTRKLQKLSMQESCLEKNLLYYRSD